MKTSHTPGPWTFLPGNVLVAGKNGLHLGTFSESCGLGNAAEPNKALIAAAPDMLAALQAIIEEAGPSFGHSDGPGTINRMAYAARAAIAKATGEKA